mmetsp:Transcript_18321/g.32934  ORF Transcript_18321/g.32934 Transcript_18321/m.32934 type:complete len:289 (+) Transcript_18321:3-869(+)
MQDFQAGMACSLSKKGTSLSGIAKTLRVEPDAVLDLIARKTQLDKYVVEVIFSSMELGLSIKDMDPSIPVEALKAFLPEPPQTDQSRDYRAEIKECYREGMSVPQIVDCLGVSETEVRNVLDDNSASVAESQSNAVTEGIPVKVPGVGEGSQHSAIMDKPAERIENQQRVDEEAQEREGMLAEQKLKEENERMQREMIIAEQKLKEENERMQREMNIAEQKLQREYNSKLLELTLKREREIGLREVRKIQERMEIREQEEAEKKQRKKMMQILEMKREADMFSMLYRR